MSTRLNTRSNGTLAPHVPRAEFVDQNVINAAVRRDDVQQNWVVQHGSICSPRVDLLDESVETDLGHENYDAIRSALAHSPRFS